MNEINYSFSRTNFVNNQSYNERTHATAWAYGIPDFVIDGFEIDKISNTISAGTAINNGLPIALGTASEKQAITLEYKFVYIKTVLNGSQSLTTIVESDEELTNTSTVFYFKIYDLENDDDLRWSSYVKDIHFEDHGDDKFVLVLNGKKSPEFSTSVIQSAFTRTESVKIFRNVCRIEENFVDADFAGVTAIAELLDIIVRNTTSGYGSDKLYNASDSVDYTCASASYTNFWRIVNTHLGLNANDVGLFVWEKRNLESTKAKSKLSITYPAINRTYHYFVNNGDPQYTVLLANATFGNVAMDTLTSDEVDTNKVDTYSVNAVTAAIESTLSAYRMDATNMVSTNVTANKITSTGLVKAETVNAETINATGSIWSDGSIGSSTQLYTDGRVMAYGITLLATQNLITGYTSNTSGAQGFEFVDIRYDDGSQEFTFGKNSVSAISDRIIFIRDYANNSSVVNAGVEIGYTIGEKMHHVVGGTKHQIPYMADVTRSNLTMLQLMEQQADLNTELSKEQSVVDKQLAFKSNLNTEIISRLVYLKEDNENVIKQAQEALLAGNESENIEHIQEIISENEKELEKINLELEKRGYNE